MHNHPTLSSKARIQSLPTLATIPDSQTPSVSLGQTAVFRRSSVIANVPTTIGMQLLMQNGNNIVRRPPSRSSNRLTTVPNVVHIPTFQKTEAIFFESRVNQIANGCPLPTEVMRKKSTMNQNVAFLPIGSATILPPAIKKIVSQTIATKEDILETPQNIEDFTVYSPKSAAVKGYSRRNVEIRDGCCTKLSNCFSPTSSLGNTEKSSAGCLKCCPCWLLTVLGILGLIIATAAGLIVYKNYRNFKFGQNLDYKCKDGWHYIDGKCYGCPAGAVWDGVQCIKNSLVVTGTTRSQINSGGVLNMNQQGDTQTNYQIDKTIINSAINQEGEVRKNITTFKKYITEKDPNLHHVKLYNN